jgi:cystine transport system substrate-binding protein
VKIVASQNDAEQVGVLIRKNEGLQQAINKALDGIKADGEDFQYLLRDRCL